jgi:hypothetical protein
MAQDFSLRYTLVDGQGNFGSSTATTPRPCVTPKCRLDRIASDLTADIDKETVDFGPNYDGKELEPSGPADAHPNLLINGSAGIAVGMATNIPPHNLNEVVAGCLALLENPAITIDDLIDIIPAPDFPTAGLIYGVMGVREGYKTGRGRVIMRARTHFEDIGKGDRQALIVDEIPYQVNKKSLIEKIAELVNEKKIEGISDIRDESDKSGMRIVIELKRGEVGEVILNNLYKQTQLQDTFGMNMVALVDGQPRLLNLKQMLECFLSHRREVVTRRTVFELRKARERGHILEGLAVALSNVDEIIALIKAAPTPPDAKRGLMARDWRSPVVEEMLVRAASDASRPDGLAPEFGLSAQGYRLSDAQAQAILELRLQRLTGLEQDKIVGEYKDVMAKILDLLDILAKPERITEIIVAELVPIREQFGDERRSEIVLQTQELRHRRPDHADGHGRHAVARRLHQGPAAGRLPRPAPRRPRQAGGGDQGRGFRRSPVRRQYPRLHPVLLEPRPLLLAQGLRSAAGQPDQPRQADRQSLPAGRGRTDQRRAAGQGIRRRQVHLHGDPRRYGQEDAAVRLLQPAQGRHHRRRSARRRLPDWRRADHRPERHRAGVGRRQGGLVRRRRRPSDGPRCPRCARHEAAGRPDGHFPAGCRERSADRAGRHRKRFTASAPCWPISATPVAARRASRRLPTPSATAW